jgi:iron complex outermembrane receptor protein
MSHYRFPASTLLCSFALAGFSLAQEAPPPTEDTGGLLDEIMVTAQRREEAIQDVPIAVSAYSADQMARLNVTETIDLGRLIPNLVAHNNTGLGSANVYSLRALNNTESIATFDPPVGSYVDDIFISRQNANNFSFFDVDRVEVLRGPQGTLFGRNTTGGAVSIILKKPAEEMGGFVEAGFGQFAEYSARASIDLPISSSFLTKLSAFYRQDDGYVSNPTTGEDDLNSEDNLGVRAAVRWIASENVTWDLAADYMDEDYMALLNYSADEPPTLGAVTRVNCPSGTITRSRYSCTGLRTDRSNLVGFFTGDKQNFPLGNEVQAYSVTSNLGWNTGLGALNFITGWRDLSQEFALDFFNDPAPTGGFTIANDGDHEQFTQEIKLTGSSDRIAFVTGVYYLDEDNTTDFGDLFVVRPLNDISQPALLTLILEDRILDNTTKAWAGYGQVDFNLTDRLTLTGGVRYTDEEKEIAYTPNPNPRIATPPENRISTANIIARGVPVQQDTQQWTPRAAIKFETSDDVMFFASATRGFKSGGWNARGTSPEQITPFDPEKTLSYEAGMRSELLDKRMRLNVTAFFADTEDYQLPAAFATATGGIVFITRNFASLENTGVELELAWALTESLTFFANVGIQNPEYKDLDPTIVTQQQDCQAALGGQSVPNRANPSGPPLPAAAGVARNCGTGIVNPAGEIAEPVRAPDTYAVGGEYVFRFNNGWTLTPSVRATHFSDQNVGTAGTAVALVDAFTDIGASLTLADGDGGWSVSASCNNCTDELMQNSILAELVYYQEPRTWSVLLNYKY